MENEFLLKYRREKNEEIRKNAEERFIPIVRPFSEDIIDLIINLKKPKKVLEIGTAIGFSTMNIYRQMEKYTTPYITTIERHEKRRDEALENFKKNNMEINLIHGDAIEEIEKIKEKFDLIFLDGPKAQYLNYYLKLIEMLEEEGIIIIDNIMHNGDIAKDRYEIKRRDRTVHKRMREFLEYLKNDERVEFTLIPAEDTLAILQKR